MLPLRRGVRRKSIFLVKSLVSCMVCSEFDGISFDTSHEAFLAPLHSDIHDPWSFSDSFLCPVSIATKYFKIDLFWTGEVYVQNLAKYTVKHIKICSTLLQPTPWPNWIISWHETPHVNAFRKTEAIFEFYPGSWDIGTFRGFRGVRLGLKNW